MKDTINDLKARALAEISEAADEKALKEVNARYLGRKGEVASLFSRMPGLAEAERKTAGRLINELKAALESAFAAAAEGINEKASRDQALDVTLPGRPMAVGRLHPITKVMEEICAIFTRMGFSVAEGPEVELDWYNFEALNFPPDHPARDMQDTFFVSDGVVLRTHTSPLQVRTMECRKPPVRVIAPGKVFRCDSDVTHTPMFHQVEGLVVDRGISFADLKGTLTEFVTGMFGPGTPLRFRPSFFPFTEPSAEVDIGCVMCKGAGCRICKKTGWLEILGSGMVHPAVFENVHYDTSVYTGFAFGLGVERVAMLKYGIDDIRRFFENDGKFLQQF